MNECYYSFLGMTQYIARKEVREIGFFPFNFFFNFSDCQKNLNIIILFKVIFLFQNGIGKTAVGLKT